MQIVLYCIRIVILSKYCRVGLRWLCPLLCVFGTQLWDLLHDLSIAIANSKEIISYSNDEYTWSKKCNPIGQYISNNIVFACLVLFNILHNYTNNHVLHFALRLIKLATTRFLVLLVQKWGAIWIDKIHILNLQYWIREFCKC